MSTNIAHLNQRFQAINQFISARSNQHANLAEINQELANIAILLNTRQLSLQIFSQFPLLSNGLKNFFNAYAGLRQFYNSKIIDLPINLTFTSINKPSTLLLKSNSVAGQAEARHELFSGQSILIGRDLQHFNSAKLLHIPLPMYKKISGRHAEIQSVISSISTQQSWQICDLGSTNGTYINGQKIKGCQVLQSNDKITLGYSNANEKAPEFLFTGQNIASDAKNSNINLVDAELVFLVIHPTQGLSITEKQLIEGASKASIFGFIIVADVSGTKPQDIQSIKTNLASIQSWIQVQYPQLASSLEFIELPLYFFYPSTPAAPLSPEIEQQFVQFANPFINLAKSKGAELLASRINLQLQIQIQRIDEILSSQEEALKHEIQRTESCLSGRTLEYWRDQYIRMKKQVEEARDDFFREAKTQFSRTRDEFSTEFIPNSLIQKVDTPFPVKE